MNLIKKVILIIALLTLICESASKPLIKSRQKRIIQGSGIDAQIIATQANIYQKQHEGVTNSVQIEQPKQGVTEILAGFFYQIENFFNSLTDGPKKNKLPELDIEFIDHFNADPEYY